MSAKRTAKSADKSLIIQNLDIKQVNRTNVDLEKWRRALTSAESLTSENRRDLYELYADVLLDGQLKAVADKRCLAITNSELMFTKDGKPIDELWPIIQSKQMKKVLRLIVEAKLYGHSLIEFEPVPDSLFNVFLVDRRHVKPRMGLVVKATGDQQGYPYRENPWRNFTIEVGDTDDYGLLLQAAQYVIYKRNGLGDFADYLQIYGVPFRHGKYKNEESRKVLGQMLEQMGSAGWAATPDDVTIEIMRAEGAGAANQIFKGFNDVMNEAIAVSVLGQTMTTNDSHNSGYAQGAIHAGVEEEIHRDDMAFVLSYLNDNFIRVLANMGYPVDGGEFAWVEKDSLTLLDRQKIDAFVLQNVPVDKAYIYQTYGVPAPTGGDTIGGYTPPPTIPAGNQKNARVHKQQLKQQQYTPGFWETLTNFFA